MTDLARVAALEVAGRAALPALAERTVAGWLLRVSGGATKRVNSANPLPGAAPVAAVRAEAEAAYTAAGLPCRFRLTPLAPPGADAALAQAGYAVADPSWTMVASPGPVAPDPAVRLTHLPDADALAAAGVLSGRAETAAAIHVRLLAGIGGAKGFAVLHDDGRPVAAGYASIGTSEIGAMAQLADIVVAEDRRGQGLGRRLVTQLLGWAHAQGAGAMLQVLDANEPARRLYRSLGFVDAYPYHYRIRE